MWRGSRILGGGDLVKIDCAACLHVALLTLGGLMKLGLSPKTKVLSLKPGQMPRVSSEKPDRRFGKAGTL
jgi:hypothetical protein